MPGCFLDTTVLIEAAAGDRPLSGACRTAIKANPPANVAVYALRELLTGYLRYLCELHNVLHASHDVGEALRALAARAYRERRKGLMRIDELGSQLQKAFAPSSLPRDGIKGEILDSLALKIARVWKQANKNVQWTSTQPLACFNHGEISHGPAGELRGPNDSFNCKIEERCAAAGWLHDDEPSLQRMIDALRPPKGSNTTEKPESASRRRALKDLSKDGPVRFDKRKCRAIGDAYFAAMCPLSSALLTTNLSDFEALCKALGKKAIKP